MLKHVLFLAINIWILNPLCGQEQLFSEIEEPISAINTQSFISNGFKLDSVVQFVFNESSQNWDKKNTKQAYSYDTKGNETETINYLWDENTEKWKNVDKKESSHTTSGILMTDTHYKWDELGEWNNDRKYTYSYNSKLLLKEILIWEASSNTWEARQRVRIDYYESGHIKEEIRLVRAAPEIPWEPTRKKFYLYKDGKKESLGISFWNEQTHSWAPLFLYNYLYNRTDHTLEQIIRFTKSNDDWVKISAVLYNYNISKELEAINVEYDDHDGKGYKEVEEKRYTHNFGVSANKLLLPYKNRNTSPNVFHHQLTKNKLSRYDRSFDKVVQYKEENYYYSAIGTPTNVPSTGEEIINVSPNPASNYLSINWPNKAETIQLSLYDCTGKLVLSNQYLTGEKIDISQLQRGIYIYQLSQGQTHIKGKLLVQ
ncbi:T9SS type A sorting domain-containing protein [Labilibacter marinus]|uniref:T9SS type A sorting domain-containing protein n=1 Tax=Labilibacter marinus TaxID=1477105 RepID=UPI000834EE45|nr:T9SS type A sorting domain-containing protein [Labilibacter marinus]